MVQTHFQFFFIVCFSLPDFFIDDFSLDFLEGFFGCGNSGYFGSGKANLPEQFDRLGSRTQDLYNSHTEHSPCCGDCFIIIITFAFVFNPLLISEQNNVRV